MVITKSNCMMVATSVLLFAFALLLSPPIVMAQVSPWSLFQQAMFERRASHTGPSVRDFYRHSNLLLRQVLIQQQVRIQQQALIQQQVLIQQQTIQQQVQRTGFVLQNNFCVPTTTSQRRVEYSNGNMSYWLCITE